MKFLAMHISNQKLNFDIFTVEKSTKYLHGSSFFNVLMIFDIKKKSIILTHIMHFLAIATNITMLLKTGFVVQAEPILLMRRIRKLRGAPKTPGVFLWEHLRCIHPTTPHSA